MKAIHRWRSAVPLWQTERDFSADEFAVAAARHFCTSRLNRFVGNAVPADARVAGLISDAELVVSELVTNAVRAGSSRISVRLTVDDDGLQVAVRDDAPGRPNPRAATVHDRDGRGLSIVEALSSAWGVTEAAPHKSVWARLTLPVAPADLAVAAGHRQR
jgi:anti-sigma regulatory factor (Ser/Thr protein kinase)